MEYNINTMLNSEIQLEQEIIGALISDPTLMTYLAEIKDKYFRISAHKEMLKAINKMNSEGIAIDLVSFLNYNKSKVKHMNSISYISDVATCNPTTRDFKSKLEVLKENYKVSIIKGTMGLVADSGTSIELISIVEEALREVHETTTNKELNIADDYEAYLSDLYSENVETGAKSCLYNLDNILGGFVKGRLITFHARSGVGKTTVCVQIALNMVMKKYKVVYGSGEMSKGEVINKMVASKLTIPYEVLSSRKTTPEQKDQISKMIAYMMEQDFYISTTTDIDKFIAEIKLYKMKYGLDVVFVDYINKYVKSNNGKNLTQQIGEVTNSLKQLALDEQICIVTLAQTNREADKKAGEVNEKISEGDVQDSARIEQDSDQLIGIYRNKKLDNPEYRAATQDQINYNSKNAEVNPGCINLIVQKNRHGKKGTLAFRWNGEYSRVSNFER